MQTKIIIKVSFFLVFVFCFFTGCTVQETIYLGDVEVNAPVTLPPTHLNINKDVGEVTISPAFSYINRRIIKGSTDNRLNFELDLPDQSKYVPKKDNLLWNVPEYSFGANLDVKVSKAFSLYAGFNFSSNVKGNHLSGGNFGVGFHNHLVNPMVRLDFGFSFQNEEYFAVTIVETSESGIFTDSRSVYIYGDKGNSINLNPFFTLTINSARDSSFINFFGTIGFFTQTLLDFSPGETRYEFFPFVYEKRIVDQRADFTNYFIYLNPGLSFRINNQIRLLVSARLLENMSGTSGSSIIAPSVQLDFQF